MTRVADMLRAWLMLMVLVVAAPAPALADLSVQSVAQAAPRLAAGGFVLLMRHGETEPGVGDPDGFDLDQCSTQRNLSARGRDHSRRLGEAFRAAGVSLHRVEHSRWCRCRDTAVLAFGEAVPNPLLDSIFGGRDEGPDRNRQLAAQAAALPATANVLWVTHQVNVSAATGVFTSQGDIIVTRLVQGRFEPLYRIRHDE